MTRRCDQCGEERNTRGLYRWNVDISDGVRQSTGKEEIHICHACHEKHGTPIRIWCGDITYYAPPPQGSREERKGRKET